MKFRKKEINTAFQENKISCWDIAKQNFKLINESCEVIGKTLKTLKTDSNLTKDTKKIGLVKSDELISQTVQDLKNSINILKECKINNGVTRNIIDQNPKMNLPLRLPN